MKLDELLLSNDFFGRETVEVYHCDKCGLVLVFDSHPIDKRIVIYSSKGRCPDCGAELDETLRCDIFRRGFGKWVDPRLEIGLFQGTAGLLDWSLGKPSQSTNKALENSKLSRLTHSHAEGILVLFFGKLALRQAHFECVTTASEGGKVIFLDGGNSFNVFHLRDGIEAFGLKAHEHALMDRIIISRAFNYHQFTSLVTRKLPEVLDAYHPKLIIASDPTSLYEEEGVIDKTEAWYSYKKMVWALRRFTKTSGVKTIINSPNPNTKAGLILKDMTDEIVDWTRPRELDQTHESPSLMLPCS
ncbi:MAG TPA: hypothetical protein VE177_05180 [Candidatus Binatus sp.]|nr:hypothetical protein [Candidatus Binatus sp.]